MSQVYQTIKNVEYKSCTYHHLARTNKKSMQAVVAAIVPQKFQGNGGKHCTTIVVRSTALHYNMIVVGSMERIKWLG